MSATDKVELYRQWQDALARYGDTRVATDLFFELTKQIEASPFLDVQGFEAVLERLALLFSDSESNQLIENKEVEIPDDIWP